MTLQISRLGWLVVIGAAGCVEGGDAPDSIADINNAQTSLTTCEAMAFEVGVEAHHASCARDEMAITRYLRSNGFHGEAWDPLDRIPNREATFSFGAQPGEGRWALWRCIRWLHGGRYEDFLSSDPNCEGYTNGNNGLHGYSLPGGRPVYRCLVGGRDHMLSWDPNCEGTQVEGVVGYARW